MKTPRCHVPDLTGPSLELSSADAHHVVHVLRLGEGDDLVVFDGRGREWLTRLTRVTRDRVLAEVIEGRTPIAEPAVAVSLAIGLLKGDQMSTVIRDATATGVVTIQPFVSDHVALPGEAWQTRARERWPRIAGSSAAQCGRAVVPEIRDVCRFDDLLQSSEAVKLMCVEPGRAASPAGLPAEPPLSLLLAVGPEGGWSEKEVTAAVAAGFRALTLGPRMLRAEIAPTVALTTLWARWSQGPSDLGLEVR